MRYAQIGSLSITLAILLALTPPQLVAQQRDAEVLLQTAMHAEQVEGDLERAIQLYRELLESHPGTREVAAKAQLHIGLCYEKLGLTEARQAYRSVIDDFPEQRGEVATARQRLASLTEELAELRRQPTFRRVDIATEPGNGVLSPDGERLAFVSDGAVWVVPLHGNVDPNIAGEPTHVADVPGAWNVGHVLAWSADAEWIAVNSGDGEDEAVYVLRAEGGAAPRMIRMPPRRGTRGYRLSLSPHGRRLAFTGIDLDVGAQEAHNFTSHVYVVPIEGGEQQRVSSSWGSQAAFSPDGEFIAYVGNREITEATASARPRRPDAGDLWVVSAAGGAPVKLAEADGILGGPVWSPDGTFLAAQGPPSSSGVREVLVYPLSSETLGAGEPIRISLPLMGVGTLAGWTPDNELGIFLASEYHSAIYTVPASGGKAVQVTPDAIVYYPRWSPDGERIYLRVVEMDEEPRVTIGYVPADGGDIVSVPGPQPPLMTVVPGGGHNVSPDGRQIVVIAAGLPDEPASYGDLWTVPVDDSGPPTRLTSNPSGERYPCWSPDGRWIAFTGWHAKSEDEGFAAIFLVPAGGGEIRLVTANDDTVGDGAIAFSPDGERIVFFSDGAIKTIPLSGGEPQVLVDEVTSSMHSRLEWSPDGTQIAHNVYGRIWITPLDGSGPHVLETGLPDDLRIYDFGWSPDGERIAFMVERRTETEFWLISDFLPDDGGSP